MLVLVVILLGVIGFLLIGTSVAVKGSKDGYQRHVFEAEGTFAKGFGVVGIVLIMLALLLLALTAPPL